MATITSTFTFGGMDSVGDPANVGVPDTSLRVQDRAYTACVDLVNFDVDNDFNAIRREGSSQIVAADVTSAWSDGDQAICISNSVLNTFDGAVLAPSGNSPTLGATEFVQVNDVVVFSDNATIGHICDGVTTIISSPSEAIDLLDLETWVKLTYPEAAISEASEGNLGIDAFKLTTFAGKCLEFFNGALYLAVDNFIFCTKTFNIESMDIRYNVVAGFNAPVTMIKGVADGLFVGTEKGTYFLAGSRVHVQDESTISVSRGFTQKKILPFGVIYGSAVTVSADKVELLKTGDLAVTWMTSNGVYAGGTGGKYVNLTDDKMVMPEVTTIASIVRRQGEAWLYIAASSGGVAVAVNLKNGFHSRYTSYDFTGFFLLGKQPYGANSSGIFLLEGDKDNQINDIDAYATTPVADFGVPQLKLCPDAYLHTRTEGDLVLDLFVDEIAVTTGLPFEGPAVTGVGVRRLRAKLPRGVEGTNWQFKTSNVAGCRCTLFSLKVPPVVSRRTI